MRVDIVFHALFCLLLLLVNISCTSLSSSSGINRLVIEKNWVRHTLDKEHLGSYRQHHFDPVLYENLVIQANGIDGLKAYDRDTAALQWRLPLENGAESSAILLGSHLFFGAGDGLFYSVDAATGAVQWTYPLKSEGLAKPFFHDGVIYILSGNNIMHALEASSGRSLWTYTRRDTSNLSIRGGSQPNVVDGVVYAGFSDGFLVALKTKDGTLLWEISLNKNRRFRDVDAHPVIDGDRIYATGYDSALYSLQKSDGKILWSVEAGGHSAPTIVGQKIFLSTSAGEVMSLDKASGKILWRLPNPEGISGRPIIYKNLLIFGEYNGKLHFNDLESGRSIDSFESGWGIHSTPVIDEARNRLYVMSAGANLYALSLKWQRHARLWPWED